LVFLLDNEFLESVHFLLQLGIASGGYFIILIIDFHLILLEHLDSLKHVLTLSPAPNHKFIIALIPVVLFYTWFDLTVQIVKVLFE